MHLQNACQCQMTNFFLLSTKMIELEPNLNKTAWSASSPSFHCAVTSALILFREVGPPSGDKAPFLRGGGPG